MLKKSDNDRLTQTGPGTPMGNVLRRYWIPALLSRELPEPDSVPVRLRLLSEDLVAFRISDGRVGLLSEKCPHRGASLFFGRNEDCGIRCIYHGWKFDIDGQCHDTPNEPAESKIKAQVRAVAYPCVEMGGVVWIYMGPPDEQPAFQTQEWMRLPEEHSFVTKNLAEANYLQMMEGGFDSSHSSFLHRTRALEEQGGETWTFRVQGKAPRLDVQITDYGYAYASLRELGKPDEQYVRVVQFVMPFHQFRAIDDPAKRSMVHGHIWVPIDDENCWVWSWMYPKDGKYLSSDYVDKLERIGGRSEEFFIPGTYRMRQNRANDYEIDRAAQRTTSFTGIKGIGAQDQAAQESMGRIADRSIEHLGMSDVAVVHLRRLLLQATRDVENGDRPRGLELESIDIRPIEKVLHGAEPWHEQLAADMVALY